MTSNRDRAAEVMAAAFHAAEVGGPLYTDAENPREAVLDATYDLHLVARALEDEGLLDGADLPEPYVVAGVGDADVTAWQPCHTIMRTDFTGGAASEVEIPAGNVWIEHDSIVAFDVDHSEMHLGTGEARALALALLAAAAHAQKEETNE